MIKGYGYEARFVQRPQRQRLRGVSKGYVKFFDRKTSLDDDTGIVTLTVTGRLRYVF